MSEEEVEEEVDDEDFLLDKMTVGDLRLLIQGVPEDVEVIIGESGVPVCRWQVDDEYDSDTPHVRLIPAWEVTG